MFWYPILVLVLLNCFLGISRLIKNVSLILISDTQVKIKTILHVKNVLHPVNCYN